MSDFLYSLLKQKGKIFVLLLFVILGGIFIPKTTLAATPSVNAAALATYTALDDCGSGLLGNLRTNNTCVTAAETQAATYAIGSPERAAANIVAQAARNAYNSGSNYNNINLVAYAAYLSISRSDNPNAAQILANVQNQVNRAAANVAIDCTGVVNSLSPACLYINSLAWTGDAVYYSSFKTSLFIGSTFQEVMNTLVNDPDWVITKEPIFLIGWNATKNLANMLIVLALIGTAVAMILRINEYKSIKSLVPIVIIALLINFTPIFIGLFIDASDIIMTTFTSGASQEAGIINTIGGNSDDLHTPGQGVAGNLFNQLGVPGATSVNSYPRAQSYIILSAAFALIYILIALVLTYLMALMMVRYVLLGILFILSPLAFVLRVFPVPQAKAQWSKWWETFIKWCFIGIGGTFFLWLSVQMLQSPGLAITSSIPANSTDISVIGPLIFNLSIILLVLVIGLRTTTKSADPLAKAAIGLVTTALTGGATLGLSAATSLAKNTGKVAGSTVPGQYIKDKTGGAYYGARDWLTKRGESIGLLTQGQTNLNQQNRNAAKMKPFEQFAEAQKDPGELAKIAMNSNNSAERAAYIAVLQKRKQLDKITPVANRPKAIKDAKAHGIDVSEFKNTDYRYAEFEDVNGESLKTIGTRLGLPTTDPAVKLAAVQQQLQENLSGMSSKQRRNIDIAHITHELTTSESFTANMAKNFRTADGPRIAALKATLPAITTAITTAAALNPPNTREVNRLQAIYDEIDRL